MQCYYPACQKKLTSTVDNVSCPYCRTYVYCSPTCRQLHWDISHKISCTGYATPNSNVIPSTSALDTSNASSDSRKKQKSVEDFEVINQPSKSNPDLGKGSFGQVKLVRDKTEPNKQYAMKVINKKQLMQFSGIDYLKREIKIQKKLDHPHIVKLFHYFEDKDNVYLILEYAKNGNLFFYLRKKKTLTEKEAFIYFFQTCVGIDYLHKKGILHRDLKPENLLLDASGNIKVCDFGWSAEDVGKRNTFCGTVDYMAPEMVQNKAHDFKIDIWSLGVLLFELLHGYPPFRGKTANEKFQSILEKEIKFKDGLSSEVKDLITNLLRSEPSMRPGFDYIFNHTWIQKNEKEFGMSVKNFIYDPTKKKEKDKSKGERSPSPISQPAVPTSNAPIGQPMTPTSSNMGLPLSIDPKIANPPGQYSTVSPRTDYKAQPTSPMGNNPFPTTGFSDLKTTSSPYSSMSQIPTSPARSRNNLEDPFAQPGKTDSPSKGLNKAQELVQSIFTPARDKSKSPPRSGIFSPHKQYDAPVTGKGLVDDILNKRKTTHENPIGNLAGVDFDASKRKTTNDISTIGQIDRTNRFGLDYAAQPSSMNNISGPFTHKETSPFPKVERSNSDNAIAFKPAGPIQGYPLTGTHSKSPSRDLSDLTKSAYASKVDPNVLKKDVDDDVPDIKESTKKENLQFGNNLTKSPNATSQAQERNFNPFGATTPSGISTDLSKSPKANVQASPYADYSQTGYSHVSPKVQTQAPGGYLLPETNKPITPTGSGDKSLNKANDFLHPDVHKMISPSNATAGNYSANKFVQPQPSGKDLSINTSSNVYQASDYGQTPKSPGRVFESKPVVAPQNYTSTQPQSYHADPYKQQQTDYTYKESPQTKAADPYKQQQGDYMYKEPPQAKVTDERAAEKAKRAEYEERNQHKVPETRPKMEAQGDFFVPQGNDIDSLLKKYDTPATSGQFADGVKGFESDPVRFTRVTNLLQKGHLSEVDQILEKMTHNEEKGHVDNDRGRKVQEQKPGHQGRDRSPHGDTEFRVTNIDKYLASYDIENTEENQILDMLDTYYTTGKMEDDGNQRYPKKQANETKPAPKTNVDESIGEMSFQVDAPQKGYEDNSSRKLRNEMSFQEGDSRYDDRNQGQRQAKTEMSFADMSQDGEESPLYEKSRGQRTGQKTPQHIEEIHEHEEEDDYYEQKTRGKKGMESDVNKRRQQEQQKPVQNNYQHEESEEEQREQRYRREEARNRGKENQKSQETKGGKKGRVSSEEEEKQRMGYEKERGVKNEDRRGKDVSPGGYDKKIKEEAGSFIVRMVEKERSEPTMNRPKGGYEGNVGVKRGNLQQKEGGRNMESQREDLIKQYRNKMNGLYSFNSESTLTMKEENESHYEYEEPVNQEYGYRNEKGFAKEDGNREQRRNKKVEDEYEDDHDNGYGRRYNDRKEERNPYEKDNRQKPKKKKNEWERGYGEDSYEEHDANYYKQKLLMTNPKSMTESYDDMIKRKQRLEYYMDDLDLDDSRTVSRPSWKNIREIPKYQEEEPKNETLLGKISSLFGCLDRSEKKPQQKTRKGRKV